MASFSGANEIGAGIGKDTLNGLFTHGVDVFRQVGFAQLLHQIQMPPARCDDISLSVPWHWLRIVPGMDSPGKPLGYCDRAVCPLCWWWYAGELVLAGRVAGRFLRHRENPMA